MGSAQPTYNQVPQDYQQQPGQPSENPFVIHKPVDTYGDPTYDGVRPPQSYPVDYLNQIEAKPQPKPLNPKLVLGAIGGALVVLGVMASFIFSGNTEPDITTRAGRLYARYTTLYEAASDNHKNLKSGELQSVNTSYQTFLKTAAAELNTSVKAGYGVKELKKALSKSDEKAEKDYSAKLKGKLADAALNGTIDRIYTREMIYEIDLLGPQISSIQLDNRNKDVKEVLDRTAANLITIKKTFNDYSATSS